MDKYYYGKQLGFYIGVQVSEEDLELTEEQFNTFNGKRVDIVDGELVEIPKTEDELKAEIDYAIQLMLDTKAQSLRYNNIDSISKFLGYDNAFRSECERLGAWSASCWVKAGAIETEVKLGLREQPTKEEVLAEMPSYT